jgi:DNA invertase Pin-like site-specific DNA recombinase
MTGKFIAYYRVSTARQGKSGLGLEAQKASVEQYLNGGRWQFIAELVEIESGKRSDRPKLAEALRLCRLHKATLLVAKLDRLARNVHFISSLMASGVKFRAVDMPEINEMVVHILASVAESEAKAISARTKAALAAAKARGQVLGGLRWNLSSVGRQGRKAALQVRQANAASYREDVLPIVADIQASGATSLRQIAAELNERGIPTRRGSAWSAVQVSRVRLTDAAHGYRIYSDLLETHYGDHQNSLCGGQLDGFKDVMRVRGLRYRCYRFFGARRN